MSTEAFSGVNATIKKDSNAVNADCVFWAFDPKVVEHRYASDKTGGGKRVIVCVRDFDARIRIKLPGTSGVPWNVGDSIVVQFHGDATGNNYIAATCIVLGGPIETDINDGVPTEIEYTLGPGSIAVFHGLYWGGAGSSGSHAPA